jgi:CheY-like chemotaxis protein
MEPGAWARMSIQDSGMGMTEEVQEHLFEPFYTTKQKGQGTGLGLAQVYGIVVRQHRGAIDVESEVDQGTTIRIYLPLTGDTEAEVAQPQPEAAQGRGETILLVEDQTELREAVSSLLRSLGYQVHQAPDGTEALRRYEAALPQGGIDLVVSDLVMPEMSGRTLARALREIDPEVKLLAITGYPLGDVMDELKAVGFLDVIHKPLDADAFARSVRDALDGPPARLSESRQRA